MRAVLTAAQTLREADPVRIVEIPMVWINCRDRSTGNPNGIGLWRGVDVESIAVRDMFGDYTATRTFYHGALLDVANVRAYVGLDNRPFSLVLSGRHPAVLTAFFAREARGAEVCVYKRIYNYDTHKALGVEEWTKGYINTAPLDRPVPGEETSIEVEVNSPSLSLYNTAGMVISDETQKKRNGDRMCQYLTGSPTWQIPWGQKASPASDGS